MTHTLLPRIPRAFWILFMFSFLLPLRGVMAVVVFSDNFSDGNASNWRLGNMYTVTNDNPAGEPTAGSQWLYSTGTTQFNASQSPTGGFSQVAVNATTSIQFSVGVEFVTSIPNRLDLYLRTNDGNYSAGGASDNAYGLKLTAIGTTGTVELALSRRSANVETILATAASQITLTASTYYRTELTVANGGALTASIFDASGTLLSTVNAVDTSHTAFASVVSSLRQSSSTTGFRTTDYMVQTLAVPEPSTVLLLGIAPLVLLGRRRRK